MQINNAVQFIKFVFQLYTNPFNALPKETSESGVSSFCYFGKEMIIVYDSIIANDILKTNSSSYIKHPAISDTIGDAIGGSLFSAEGDDWKRQREIFASAFAPKEISKYTPEIIKYFDNCAENLPTQVSVDIYDKMIDATLGVLLTALLGEPDDYVSAIKHNIYRYLSSICLKASLYAMGLRSTYMNRFITRYSVREMKKIAENILDGKSNYPLVSAHRLLPRKSSVANMITFLASGHETTAIGIAWAIDILSKDLPLQDSIRSSLANSKDWMNDEMLCSVINESLRLFPPGPIVARKNISEVELGGRILPPGTTIIISLYNLQRNKFLWERPDEFDLARSYSDGAGYIPFGAGKRVCIGKGLALIEMKAALKSILERYEILPTNENTEPVLWLTLRPKSGVRVILRKI